MSQQTLLWVGFNAFVLLMLCLDAYVFQRKAHVIKIKEALLWSAFWVSLAILFNILIYFLKGPKTALEFLTGYVIEQSLSIDNLFVFLIIFSYFKVPAEYQHKVLFWGILGAQVMRAVFILAGVALIQRFEWVIYIFGVFLIYTGIKMGVKKEEDTVNFEKNSILTILKKFIPVTDTYEKDKFFVRRDNRLWATPLFVILLLVDVVDLIFAVDSIPAVLAITLDPFIVYTSNIFAILGLRALYFALAGIMPLFCYLHYGLSVILVFVGFKMLASHFIKISIGFSLAFVIGVVAISMVASVMRSRASKAL